MVIPLFNKGKLRKKRQQYFVQMTIIQDRSVRKCVCGAYAENYFCQNCGQSKESLKKKKQAKQVAELNTLLIGLLEFDNIKELS